MEGRGDVALVELVAVMWRCCGSVCAVTAIWLLRWNVEHAVMQLIITF